jgi:hypothetical protein
VVLEVGLEVVQLWALAMALDLEPATGQVAARAKVGQETVLALVQVTAAGQAREAARVWGLAAGHFAMWASVAGARQQACSAEGQQRRRFHRIRRTTIATA